MIPAGALGQPAPAAPRHPGQVGRVGHRHGVPPGGHRPARRGQPRGGRPRRPTSSWCGPRGRSAPRPLVQELTVPARAARRSRSSRTSTGTSGRSCSSSPSRSTCTPTGPPPRRSSATCSARPTPTRRGTRPGSRSARTAGCTSASPATASRSPTTPPTATTSRVDEGGTGTTVRLSLLRAPVFPDPEADQGHHRLTTVLHPGAASPTRSRTATGPTCPRASCAVPDRWRRWSSSTTRRSWSRP